MYDIGDNSKHYFKNARCRCKLRYVAYIGFYNCIVRTVSVTARLSCWSLSADCSELSAKKWQESLANAKVSARQPWYIGRNSVNRPPLRIAQPYQRNLYTSLKSTFSAQQFPRWLCGCIFIRLAVVASQTYQLAQNSEKIWTYSSSRSSKVDDFGTNRKRLPISD